MTKGYQCEQCGTWGEEPAQEIKAPGYRGKVIIRLCENCTKKKEKR